MIKYCTATINWLFFFLMKGRSFFIIVSDGKSLKKKIFHELFMSFKWAFLYYQKKKLSKKKLTSFIWFCELHCKDIGIIMAKKFNQKAASYLLVFHLAP